MEIPLAKVINVPALPSAYLLPSQAQHAAALSAASQYATQQAFQVKPGQAVPQVGRRSFLLGTFLFSIWILALECLLLTLLLVLRILDITNP